MPPPKERKESKETNRSKNNNRIFNDPQLRNCQVTSAIWHFLATFIVLYLASCWPFRLFPAVRLPVTQLLPICLLFASFLVFNNLSLTYNTVGFFQLAKIMTTPCVVLFNYILYKKQVSRNKLVSVLTACAGVALANGYSTEANLFGATFAILAFAITALYQIWIAISLSDQDVSAPQLLMNQTPISVLMLLVLVPFMDTMPVFGNIHTHSPLPHLPKLTPNPTTEAIPRQTTIYFVTAGPVAALINLSQFLIIGRTSALTFNVVSIAKTISILLLGWSVEGKVFAFTDVVGVGMALGGAFMYANVKK